LSKKTGVAESQIYKILKYLELEQQIKQYKTNKYTIIAIQNWGEYQSKGEKRNNRVTTTQQQSNTYNNVNNNINKQREFFKQKEKERKDRAYEKTKRITKR